MNEESDDYKSGYEDGRADGREEGYEEGYARAQRDQQLLTILATRMLAHYGGHYTVGTDFDWKAYDIVGPTEETPGQFTWKIVKKERQS